LKNFYSSVGMKEIKEMTWKNLERYANTGLRTLVIAKREIPENIYNEWAEEYLVHFFLDF